MVEKFWKLYIDTLVHETVDYAHSVKAYSLNPKIKFCKII